MKSNYKKLGAFIEEIKIKNTNLEELELLGVSVKKKFITSIANTIGTNFKKYKIVERNQFVYIPDTSRRGNKIGIAMLDHLDRALVSTAYSVFKITDHARLLPQYLMMWFTRTEFDRYARYQSHGSVREAFDWEAMCEVELPVPSLKKQQEIVNDYNTVQERIAINEQLNTALEATAQALYKHWFVDFEFPYDFERGVIDVEHGKPYQSSGGEMVFNEELDKEIPVGWASGKLKNNCEILDRFRKPISGIERDKIQGSFPYYGAMGIVDYINKYIFDDTLLLFSEDGVYVTNKYGNPSLQYVWGKFWVNNHAHVLKGNNILTTEYLDLALKNTNVSHLVTGAAQPKINQENMGSIDILLPLKYVLKKFNKKIIIVYNMKKVCKEEINQGNQLSVILLSKMATVTD